MSANVVWFSELGLADLDQVGGKNSSLGEMVHELAEAGVRVPERVRHHRGRLPPASSPTTAWPTHHRPSSADLDIEDVRPAERGGRGHPRGDRRAALPRRPRGEIRTASPSSPAADDELSFAVRSSATAEDLPDASFAGQQETFLNIRGIEAVLQAIREVFASLYNDRAIAYRVHHEFAHEAVALSAGIQQMVRSDIGAAGRHVHHGHRVRLRPRPSSSPRRTGWARRSCRVR